MNSKMIVNLSYRENLSLGFLNRKDNPLSSRKRLHTKVTPDLQLTYSKNKGNLGFVLTGLGDLGNP